MASYRKNTGSSEVGFSMIELVVVLCIIAVFVAVAIPSYSSFTRAQNKRVARESFEAFLRRAQAISMAKGVRGVLTSTRGGAVYTFGPDYPPYNNPAANDGITLRLRLPPNCTVATSTRLIFNSRGQLVDVNGYTNTPTLTFVCNSSTFATATAYSTGTIVFN